MTPACPVLAPEIREHIERAIEAALETAQRLIGILDRADGNPDLEDGADDEPSLGAPEGHASQIVWLRGGDRDLETIRPECLS
ncbi:hypothetical protein SQ03_17715 [Methylobacterium platani JCM 14648]|uniref:Uncharacterized protein n=2 Tax=Methylobacterium platani TaxID=427683 RepID=A0A179S3M8_9HYPH|nr:hypothetical protein SQ03_17715 [Methylobacterium platani JCM 14648]OAS20799.1 hypothetical protein A5481_22125 [Methylobacterium platani]